MCREKVRKKGKKSNSLAIVKREGKKREKKSLTMKGKRKVVVIHMDHRKMEKENLPRVCMWYGDDMKRRGKGTKTHT
jgi:hypothetical protein